MNALQEYDSASAIKEDFTGLLADPFFLADTEDSQDYTKYQQDPVGFARDVLGITLTDDVIRMLESLRDNRITVARSATGTGKSFGASVAATWFYKCFPESRVYTVANPYENQKILWGELSHLTGTHPDLFAEDRVVSFNIERSPLDFIRALSVPTMGTDEAKEGKFSGKHHKHMLFVVDEGDTVPEFAYRGIEGCMSGGLIVRLLILFNPRHQSGLPYRHERDRTGNVVHLSAFGHPNVLTGEQVIPGAVDRETTVRRINLWCRPLVKGEKPDSECFELPEFLIGAIATDPSGQREYPPLEAGFYKVMEPAFSYMVLGEYPAQAVNQLISREWINRARSRWDLYVAKNGETPPWGSSATCGQDVAEFGTDLNCLCYRYGGYVERFITWSGLDILTSADKAYEEDNNRAVTYHNVDATGIGAGVSPQLQRRGRSAVAVKTANKPTVKGCELGEFRNIRDQLWWACREWLRRDDTAMLPPDEVLIEDLVTPTYQVKKGKIEVMAKADMRELLKRSPDRGDALCLTFFTGGFFDGCDFG